jgi:hypothetical protein
MTAPEHPPLSTNAVFCPDANYLSIVDKEMSIFPFTFNFDGGYAPAVRILADNRGPAHRLHAIVTSMLSAF